MPPRIFGARVGQGAPGRRVQAVSMWPRHRRRPWLLILGVVAFLLALPFLLAGALVVLVPPAVAPDQYVEAVAGEPPLLNPVLAPYTLAGQDVLPLVFAALVRTDAAGNVQLDLAEQLDVAEDGRAYVVRLRDGLRWDDGEPLTAEDVAFTVRLIQSPGHQGSQELADLWRGVEVEVADPRTVRFRLPTPLASFPEHLSLGLLPRHALDGVEASALPLHPFNRQPVGSGPYRVASFEPERLLLERNPSYHGARPALGHVELRVYGDRNAALQAVIRREVDGLAGLRPAEIEQVAASGEYVVYALPERSKTAAVIFNLETPILREAAVRKALARALDREVLIRDALAGFGEPATGPVPVQSWAYVRPPAGAEHDPAAAAALLDEAGWSVAGDGVRQREGTPLQIALVTADTPDRLAVANALVQQAKVVGIRLDVRAVPADELFDDHLQPRQFEAALVGQWSMGSDPDVYPQWHSSQTGRSGGNFAGYTDADVDRWLEVGRQEPDRELRRNAYLHFQARWVEEQPAVMLYHPIFTFAVSRDVWGVAADPLPDSSWRLRSAVGWHRVARPTAWQEARDVITSRASRWLGL
ncbi:MAG TPA: peptide ABC transporter substrate-binding protein [Chloroflexota bacterium]|nr:peptide ABC transporter substrate-binding protein [Chloroflexota bacterium]